ncbi:TlpA disulfide reductase family protein [Polaromonas sp. SM01]|uniref:TlpA disulfide reductase family protein n=1 Tax=Polaromonas sp. SM01 TaxID=3085630 RepID=UPI002980BF98|nr:TlpA disulfide reductase family protein [Polaromonas sp. SM01]MDW5441714.1 TlpA disulfide reductase family protein [Polaromonas sp. SM01]
MLSVNIGPFPLPLSQLFLMVALLVALAIGHLVGRRQKTGGIASTLSDMLLIGLLVARLVFVALWFDSYRQVPLSILDIRDGGFTLWAGLLGALGVAIGQGRRRAALRKPLIFGLAAGALVWGAMLATLHWVNKEPPVLPTVVLTTLAGESVQLTDLAAGKPLVVNLWATWCPPCRREMPVLAAAQQQESGMRFVFANQGEDGATVLRYLASSQLKLSHVVFDPRTALALAVGSRSLPTTLFYDASGRLVDSHLGELSAASLASKLRQLRVPATATPQRAP